MGAPVCDSHSIAVVRILSARRFVYLYEFSGIIGIGFGFGIGIDDFFMKHNDGA